MDHYVKSFEAAWSTGEPELAPFLPGREHPQFRRVALELIRVDIENRWGCGRVKSVDDYRRALPDLFTDKAFLADVAFEEYRQRLEHGENPSAPEYARRYGIDTAGWPAPSANEGDQNAPTAKTMVEAAFHEASLAFHRAESSDDSAADSGDGIDLLREVHRSNPLAAHRLASATIHMPEVGSDFAGFRLIEELGRGAFGSVFLAEQVNLANRRVALKITANLNDDADSESDTLAQLQHTNIMPVYSVHRADVFQAVCMPYYGATTLHDVIRALRQAGSMPGSGRHLISTLNDRRSRSTAASATRSNRPDSAVSVNDISGPSAPLATPPKAGQPRAVLDRFEKSSYVESVLWLIGRLADGLAHAHELGIVHRDLKPANILLTDAGQPMILDFNLSENNNLRNIPAGAWVGGTLPYMSPEHIRAFRGEDQVVDGRSDIYSLGLIAFELLAGRHPRPQPKGDLQKVVPIMYRDRMKPPPKVRLWNPTVSPAVDAIVSKCLEPDPAKRYQSARYLQEDIDRHLDNLPLKYVPEPSLRERLMKWSRRHPRLSSTTTVSLAASVLLVAVVVAAVVSRDRYVTRLEAAETERGRLAAAAARDRLGLARQLQEAFLNYPDQAAPARAAGLAQAALDHYRAADDPAWEQKPLVARLDPDQRAGLRRDVGLLLMNWAEAETRRGAAAGDRSTRVASLQLAMQLNERAEACFGDDASRSLRQQKARLAELLGRDDASELVNRARKTPPVLAADHLILARELMRQQEFRKAVPHLQEATRIDPRDFWAWQLLGNCYHELMQYPEAVVSYSSCLGATAEPALAYYPHHHRAIAQLALGRLSDAETDLNRAAEFLPTLPSELHERELPRLAILRAQTRVQRRDLQGAERLLTEAIHNGEQLTQLHLERARVRGLLKDETGAKADLNEALRITPIDEVGWNDRGLARLSFDPKGALDDFNRALKLNPRFHAALQNKSHVLSEHLGKPAEALAVLHQLVEFYPGYVRARIGRGVLHARAGRRAEALADARESLARDHSPLTLYQAANIYALTSKQVSADRDRVIPLLAAALWGGFGLDVIDDDGDMDPVRDMPTFRRMVEVVRELQADSQRRDR
jgi:serine/threonine protein kinase/Tfp pilus assembly protein PilF